MSTDLDATKKSSTETLRRSIKDLREEMEKGDLLAIERARLDLEREKAAAGERAAAREAEALERKDSRAAVVKVVGDVVKIAGAVVLLLVLVLGAVAGASGWFKASKEGVEIGAQPAGKP